MSDTYNKKKLPPLDRVAKRLEKEREFNKGMQELVASKPEMTDDYRKSIAKDLPVEKIDRRGQVWPQSKPSDVVDKIAAFRAMRQAGKKMMGAVPLLGAGYAALSGDPAMAAEELAGDLPFVGQAYEALKPVEAGSVDEERDLINERNARLAYENSPAHLARLRALQKLGR